MSAKHPKHHYIPVFYLNKWTDANARLVEFSRPYGKTVTPRWTSPDGTGYVRGLNTLPNLPASDAARFETVVLQNVDSLAATAFQKLLSDNKTLWTPKPRSAWTRFLLSILLRNPEAIARAVRYMERAVGPGADESRKLYEAVKGLHDPSFEDFLKIHGKQAALRVRPETSGRIA
jgi:hypothetical protein